MQILLSCNHPFTTVISFFYTSCHSPVAPMYRRQNRMKLTLGKYLGKSGWLITSVVWCGISAYSRPINLFNFLISSTLEAFLVCIIGRFITIMPSSGCFQSNVTRSASTTPGVVTFTSAVAPYNSDRLYKPL